MVDLDILIWLALAALVAGWVDAVAGGGGLLQVPALLLGLPGPGVQALGTNVAAIIVFGLGGYIWWQVALVMAVFNVVGAVIGARMALRRGSGFVRVVFLVIVAVLIVRLIVGW